jgi:hypothetical protein
MKRRTLKKQIRRLSLQLLAPTQKFLAASSSVHRDVISKYELELEHGVLDLMRVHLILDSTWPHRERWLDGVSEEFLWERKNGIAYGSGELYWGHWPDVSREITGLRFNAMLRVCLRHGAEYLFRYEDHDVLREYRSSRTCPMRGADGTIHEQK